MEGGSDPYDGYCLLIGWGNEHKERAKAGLRFKSPKTKHGRRAISLPASIVEELRRHRLEQQKLRLALGAGKDEPDALVFRNMDGSPRKPNSLTTEWRRLVRSLKLPKVSLHAWRHTHASQLIAAGMDPVTVSRRLGHGSPTITLGSTATCSTQAMTGLPQWSRRPLAAC